MELKKINLLGKRWQDSSGNTYHSVKWEANKKSGFVPFAYGYERHYEQTAIDDMKAHGVLPATLSGSLWRYCDQNSIELFNEVVDVKRKKDL